VYVECGTFGNLQVTTFHWECLVGRTMKRGEGLGRRRHLRGAGDSDSASGWAKRGATIDWVFWKEEQGDDKNWIEASLRRCQPTSLVDLSHLIVPSSCDSVAALGATTPLPEKLGESLLTSYSCITISFLGAVVGGRASLRDALLWRFGAQSGIFPVYEGIEWRRRHVGWLYAHMVL